MLICTDTRDAFTPAELPIFVKQTIEGLARGCMPAWNCWNLPPLYQSGVRFRLPKDHGAGVEYMALPPFTYADGWGDCDRLLIWWLCEQWARGLPASVSTVWLGSRMHFEGRRSWDDSGPLEDPSVILGARAV